MRIDCPNCGLRDNGEFTYLGDATVQRPDAPVRDDAGAPAAAELDAMHDYVFLRDNPRGHHREHWYHALGCRAWLQVKRNTVTHEILSVRTVGPAKTRLSPTAKLAPTPTTTENSA